MTVICYDGKTMSADKLSWGSTINIITKVFKVNGEMVGISGKSVTIPGLLKWIANGCTLEEMPEQQRDPDKYQQIMVVGKDRIIRIYESGHEPWISERGMHALGSGAEMALGSMMAGADSTASIRIACHGSMGCGMGIDTINLDDDEVKTELFKY